MTSRILRILMIAFVVMWYGLIVPGHTRGIVSVPGAKTAENCCEVKQTTCHDTAGESEEGKPARDPVSTCAICQLVSVTAPPVIIPLDLMPRYLVAELPLTRHLLPDLRAVIREHSGRDPPASTLI